MGFGQGSRLCPWTEDRLVLDTAVLNPDDAVAQIEARIDILTKQAIAGP